MSDRIDTPRRALEAPDDLSTVPLPDLREALRAGLVALADRLGTTTVADEGCDDLALVAEQRRLAALLPAQETPQHDPSLCPAWCSREHLKQAIDDGGFHHDADAWSLLPASSSTRDSDGYLFVSVSQFVPDDGQPWPVHVELQDSTRTVGLLTPDEAAQLGLALQSAATKAQQ